MKKIIISSVITFILIIALSVVANFSLMSLAAKLLCHVFMFVIMLINILYINTNKDELKIDK